MSALKIIDKEILSVTKDIFCWFGNHKKAYWKWHWLSVIALRWRCTWIVPIQRIEGFPCPFVLLFLPRLPNPPHNTHTQTQTARYWCNDPERTINPKRKKKNMIIVTYTNICKHIIFQIMTIHNWWLQSNISYSSEVKSDGQNFIDGDKLAPTKQKPRVHQSGTAHTHKQRKNVSFPLEQLPASYTEVHGKESICNKQRLSSVLLSLQSGLISDYLLYV